MGIDNVYGTGGLRPGVTTSSARPASPFNGQVIYETDTDKIAVYDGSSWVYKTADVYPKAGAILQVQSTTKTDVFTTTSTSLVDITGMSVSITPTATSSKIFVTYTVHMAYAGSTGNFAGMRLMRDSTAIYVGDAAGSRPRLSNWQRDIASIGTSSGSILDSPSTTSSVTYKLQGYCYTGSFVINRAYADDNTSTYDGRMASSITAIEVAG